MLKIVSLVVAAFIGSATTVLAQAPILFDCTPVFEQPVERNDPVNNITVLLWPSPQDIRVVHHARSGDYSRGQQYLASLRHADLNDWRWHGTYVKDRRITMDGRLYMQNGRWLYTEAMFVKGAPHYNMTAECNNPIGYREVPMEDK